MINIDESQRISRILDGKREEYAWFVKTYSQQVLRFTSRMLPDSEDAKQVAQIRAKNQVPQQVQTKTSDVDSLDYYINKIECELASMDDSLYIERIHRVIFWNIETNNH